MSELIGSKIAAVKRKHALVSVGGGAAMAVCAFLAVLAATMAADWAFELPYWARAASMAVNLAACAYIAKMSGGTSSGTSSS